MLPKIAKEVIWFQPCLAVCYDVSMISIACDVVILPNGELEAKAIDASQKLATLGALFTLKIGDYHPHASVYMLQLRDTDILSANELLAKIASKTSELNLTATKYDQSKCFFDAEYQKPNELQCLQDAVVAALNPIRDGLREKDKPRMLEATGLALDNYEKYGWNSIGALYRPHMTLTRFNTEQTNPEAKLPDSSSFSGTFSRLGLFELGNNGTAVRKIAEFNLVGSSVAR